MSCRVEASGLVGLADPEKAIDALSALGFIAAEALTSIVHEAFLAKDFLPNEVLLQAILFVEELRAKENREDAEYDIDDSNESHHGPLHPWRLQFLRRRPMNLQVLTCDFADIEADDLEEVQSETGNEQNFRHLIQRLVELNRCRVVVPDKAAQRQRVQDQLLHLGNFDELSLFVEGEDVTAGSCVHHEWKKQDCFEIG